MLGFFFHPFFTLPLSASGPFRTFMTQPRKKGEENLRRKNRFELFPLTCLNFAIASDEIKSPFWNLVTKHIT
jgi:hypothetical protein